MVGSRVFRSVFASLIAFASTNILPLSLASAQEIQSLALGCKFVEDPSYLMLRAAALNTKTDLLLAELVRSSPKSLGEEDRTLPLEVNREAARRFGLDEAEFLQRDFTADIADDRPSASIARALISRHEQRGRLDDCRKAEIATAVWLSAYISAMVDELRSELHPAEVIIKP